MNPIKFNDEDRRFVEEYVRRHYSYDKENGGIISRKTGKPLSKLCRACNSYPLLHFKFHGKYLCIRHHNVVWFLCKGFWPKKQIDHINQDATDNHIENLREVTQSENNINQTHLWKPNKDSGLPAVYPHVNGEFKTYALGKRIFRNNPFQLFFYSILFGKRFKINCK